MGILLTNPSHRAKGINPTLKKERLEGYISPLLNAWDTPELTNALASFESFCSLLGLDKVQEYMVAKRVNVIQDWSSHKLDPEALRLQADLQEKFKMLPIRATKAFITVSTDKLRKGSLAYVTACQIWHRCIPRILPNLLQFIK